MVMAIVGEVVAQQLSFSAALTIILTECNIMQARSEAYSYVAAFAVYSLLLFLRWGAVQDML